MFVGSFHCPAQKASAENPLCLPSIIFQTTKAALPIADSSRGKILRTASGKMRGSAAQLNGPAAIG